MIFLDALSFEYLLFCCLFCSLSLSHTHTHTVFDLCSDYYVIPNSRMHRQPEHVMTFLLAKMGTSGSLDGQQRLVVNERFTPKTFEGILK